MPLTFTVTSRATFEVGLLNRGTMRKACNDLIMQAPEGVTVVWVEDKGLLDSVFRVRLDGDKDMVDRTASEFCEWFNRYLEKN